MDTATVEHGSIEVESKQLLQSDVGRVLSVLPPHLLTLLQLKTYKGSMIAGGVIRAIVGNEPISDIDVFVPTAEMAEKLSKELDTESLVTKHAYTTLDHGVYPIQVIHRWTFPSPEDTIAGFDFTVTQAAIYWDGWEWMSVTAPSFYKDVASKVLVYTSPKTNDGPGSSLRLFKYLKRGYTISFENYAAVTARLMVEVLTEDYPAHTGEAIPEDQLVQSIKNHLITEDRRREDGDY